MTVWIRSDLYHNRFLIPPDDALTAALNLSEQNGLPSYAVSEAQGKFLNLLAKNIQARRILEVGTLGGYSTIWLAEALPPDGELVTCEISEDFAKINTVATFGDSLSDTGNGYRLSNHTWPPVPPFNSNGSYTDGLTWNQIFTQQFLNNAILQDFAYGCATTDSLLVQGTMGYNTNLAGDYSVRNSTKPPGVRQQIAAYINLTINQSINFDRTLYIIWIGINNYYYDPTLTPLQTVESIIDCVNVLILFGARNLILFNQLPFDRSPAYRNQTTTNATKYLYISHNEILAEQINETYFTLHTRLNIQLFDVYTFISKILDNYTAYGFENLDNCWDTESSSTVIIKCTNIKTRIFADEFHPTSAVHMLIAKQLYFTLGGSNSTSTGTKFNFNQFKFIFCWDLYILLFEIN